jgi:hypothetical protein
VKIGDEERIFCKIVNKNTNKRKDKKSKYVEFKKTTKIGNK